MALRASSSVWVYLRSSSRCSWMSPPAEKARSPAPVMTMQPTSSSALIRVTASRSSVPSWAFIALSCSGRFMVTIATPCVFSTRMESAILSLPRVAHERQCGVAYTAGGVSVLTRIDHVMLCVPNLEEGIEAYTRIGFHVYPGGPGASMEGRGTRSAQPPADLFRAAPDAAGRAAPAGGAGRRSPQRRPASGSGLHRGARRGRGGGVLWPSAGHVRAQDPARRGHQGGHGGLRSGPDGLDGGAARRARARGRGARSARARPISGALPHEQYGRRGPLDGESRHAAAGARHPQYRRAGDPGPA